MAYVSGDNIPKNAVKITPVEALRAQWEIVDEWSPGEDV